MSDRKLALNVFLKGYDALSGPLRNIVGASGAAAGSLNRLTDTQKTQRNELKVLRAEMGAAGVATREMFEREKQLETQISATTKKIVDQRAAQARIAKASAMGSQAKASGMDNLTTGAAIAAPLIYAGKQAADFQDGMTDIAQKANLSADATARLETNIKAAAQASKQMPENLRMGVDNLAGFGLDPAQAVQMISPIGKAATAYRATIDDLSKASFATYDNLKVPIGDTAKALDIMASAGKSGAFEMKDMAQYFPALTAAAQGLGQHGVGAVADLAAALQIARKGAGDSASAANNIQNLLAKINTKDTIKNFKDFGVDLPAAMKKAYAAGKTPLEAIAELTQKATGGDMSKLSFLFGDMQVQQALRPLIANMDLYRQIRADALKASGTVEADFAVRSQNASVNARLLAGNLMNIALTAGNTLLPIFVQVSQKVSNVASKMAAWSAKHPGMTDLIIKAVLAIAMMNLTLGAGRIAFGTIIGPISKAIEAFRWLKEIGVITNIVKFAAPLLAGNFAAIGTAATAFGEAMAAAGAFLMANPIILVIVAIVALLVIAVPWIIKNWDALKAGFMAFGASLAQSFAPIIQPIMAVVRFLGTVWERIKGPLAAGLQFVLNMFMNFTPLGMIIRSIMPIINWLKTIDWAGLGKMMIQGIINGILFMMGPLGLIFKKAAGAGIDAFKNKAEIHSPSRVFMGFGENISEGLRLGISRTMSEPMRQARMLAAGVAGAAALSTGSPALAGSQIGPAGTGIRPTAVSAASGAAGVNLGGVTINIYAQPGQSIEDLRKMAEDAMRNAMNQAQATRRSAYKDDDA